MRLGSGPVAPEASPNDVRSSAPIACAIEMSIFVVRAFVRMRQALAVNQQVMTKLAEIEHRLESHDAEIEELIEAIRELMTPPPANRRRIGFEVPLLASKPAGTTSKIRAMPSPSFRHGPNTGRHESSATAVVTPPVRFRARNR